MNIADAVHDALTAGADSWLRTGTVVDASDDPMLVVSLDGANLSLPKIGAYYQPVAGDVVAVLCAPGRQVVLGKYGTGASGPNPFGSGVAVQSATVTAYVNTASTTFEALSGDPAVVFVVPTSGNVLVSISSALVGEAAGIGSAAAFQIGTGDTVGAGTVVYVASSNDQISVSTDSAIECGKTTLVTGLTAGATYWAQMLYSRAGSSSFGGFSRRRITVAPTV